MSDEYAFSDLIDLTMVQELIDGFHKITGIPSSITDQDGQAILAVGANSACRGILGTTPDMNEDCSKRDAWISGELDPEGAYASCLCRNGLIDIAVPIVIGDRHMANLSIGQFFMDKKPDESFFRSQAEQHGLDIPAYLEAARELPVLPKAKVEEALLFLGNIAKLIGEMGLKQKRLARFNEKLEEEVQQRTILLSRQSEEHKQALKEFEAIFQNSSVAIVLTKGDRIIYKANDRFLTLFGYSREEALQEDTQLLYADSKDFEDFGKTHLPRMAQGKVVQLERQLRRKDDEIIWCSIYGKAINPPDLTEGIIWVVVDITERKELETLKGDVDRIMRHDLKVPLNGIIGLAQALLLDTTLSRDQLDDIKMIEESGYRMNNLINQSLELYKIETDGYEFYPIKVDMGMRMRKVVRDLSRKAGIKRLQFDIRIDGVIQEDSDGLVLDADPMLSHTMLSCVVNNAVEAAPDKSLITIAMDRKDSQAVISVHNKGAVPAEIRDTFFEKYVTVGKSGGTGLGTYTAKLMARAQGGDVAMTTGESTGTTVTITLPL